MRVSEEVVSPSLKKVPLRMYYFVSPFSRGTFPGVGLLSSQTEVRKSIVCYLKRVVSHLFRSSTNFSLTYCLYRVCYLYTHCLDLIFFCCFDGATYWPNNVFIFQAPCILFEATVYSKTTLSYLNAVRTLMTMLRLFVSMKGAAPLRMESDRI